MFVSLCLLFFLFDKKSIIYSIQKLACIYFRKYSNPNLKTYNQQIYDNINSMEVKEML